ncbi:MAG: MBOAT family O-acyltransferase [Lachnospira sp.]
MVFSSLLFLYIFLPLNLLCYAVISDIKKKNICLLFFSLVFYAWASPKYLLILIAMAFINYAAARFIEHFKKDRKAVFILAADIIVSLTCLGYFKYLGFFCDIINHFTGIFKVIPQVVLPVGISFYTFQLISYVTDVYRDDVKADKNFGNVLLYTSLYHQCIAGPIVRYKDIAGEIKCRKTNISDMSDGISRFCVGLAKKTLLANTCASVLAGLLPDTADVLFAQNMTVVAAWMAGILYMFQIYLDFSAYSDMAIGLGKMIGFHYRENFNYPYAASCVTDFWRRWHISLGTFFRDYVYIPLGGNRKGIVRQLINMLAVWLMTGLWHGASYNFVMWGLYFFVFLALEKILRYYLEKCKKTDIYDAGINCRFKLLKAVPARIYTLSVIFFGWVLFRFTDLNVALNVIKSMFGANGNAFTNFETNTILLNNIIFIVLCILAVTPLFKNIAAKLKLSAENGRTYFVEIYDVLNILMPVVLLFLSTVSLIGNSYNPFIYFRF